MHPLDLAAIDGVGDPVQSIADDSVAPLHAGGLQCFDQEIGHSVADRRTSLLWPVRIRALLSRCADRHCTSPHRRRDDADTPPTSMMCNLSTPNSAIYCTQVAPYIRMVGLP
jgi:hypothetical protein